MDLEGAALSAGVQPGRRLGAEDTWGAFAEASSSAGSIRVTKEWLGA